MEESYDGKDNGWLTDGNHWQEKEELLVAGDWLDKQVKKNSKPLPGCKKKWHEIPHGCQFSGANCANKWATAPAAPSDRKIFKWRIKVQTLSLFRDNTMQGGWGRYGSSFANYREVPAGRWTRPRLGLVAAETLPNMVDWIRRTHSHLPTRQHAGFHVSWFFVRCWQRADVGDHWWRSSPSKWSTGRRVKVMTHKLDCLG